MKQACRFLFSIALCIVICLVSVAPAPGREGDVEPQASLPSANLWYRITPSVIWCGDANDRVKIEAHIIGRTDVASVQLDNRALGIVTLYDDGTHGDTLAGDNVFTVANVHIACSDWVLSYGGDFGSMGLDMWVNLKNGSRLDYNYGPTVAAVHPRFKNRYNVRYYGNGLSATNYAFFIQDSSHDVLDDYPVSDIYCGKSNFEAYKKLYSVFADVFDMAVLVPGLTLFRPDSFGENVPYQVQARNDVQRIGVPIMNNSALFGSAGRLKSAVYHSFGSLAIIDHEMMHTWGAGIGSSLGLIEEGLPGRYHWRANSDIGGQLGYYAQTPGGQWGHFAYNGDMTWHFVSNSTNEPYAPLELYVMGLIPPEQVPPIHILTNPNFSDLAHITASAVTTVTIQQIMAAQGGPRIPAANQSQKTFKVAFIVTQDIAYNAAAYAYFSLMSAYLMTHDSPSAYTSFAPFHWATGGRGALDTHLPISLGDPTRRVIYLPLTLFNH